MIAVRWCAAWLVGALLFLAGGTVRAQTWSWARQTQSTRFGSARTRAHATVADAQGNVYVAGTFADTTRIGGTLLGSLDVSPFPYERTAAFVAQVTATGQWGWVASTEGASAAQLLTATPDGGLLVTGFFHDSLRLGALRLGNPQVGMGFFYFAGFIAHLSPQGQWEWAEVLPDGAYVLDVAADSAGNVVLAGVLSDSVTFGTTTLRSTSGSNNDLFVAKRRPAGQWAWAVQAGSPDYEPDVIDALALGAHGTAYVTGNYGPNAVFGGLHPPTLAPTTGFVAALDSAGAWQWVKPFSATRSATGHTLAWVPATGDVLVGGTTRGTATFDATVLPGDSLPDTFVARLDPATQTWRWVASASCPTALVGILALVTDAAGTAVYAAGTFGSGARATTPGPMPVYTATFGAQTVTGIGGPDNFVARLDGATGQWQHALGWGGTRVDGVGSMALLPAAGAVALTSSFGAPGLALGSFALTTNPLAVDNPGELVVARLDFAPLGVPAAAAAPRGSLVPNPATNTTQLTLPAAAVARPVAVLDALGRPVRTAVLPAHHASVGLDVRGLPAGVYVVRAGGTALRLVVE